MIQSFRHKDLKLLFEKGDRPRARSDHADKIARFEETSEIGNMGVPGFRLQPLKGNLAGSWSVMVPGIRPV